MHKFHFLKSDRLVRIAGSARIYFHTTNLGHNMWNTGVQTFLFAPLGCIECDSSGHCWVLPWKLKLWLASALFLYEEYDQSWWCQSEINHVHTLKMVAASSSNLSALHVHTAPYSTRLPTSLTSTTVRTPNVIILPFCPLVPSLLGALGRDNFCSSFWHFRGMFYVPEQLSASIRSNFYQILNRQSVAVKSVWLFFSHLDMKHVNTFWCESNSMSIGPLRKQCNQLFSLFL